MKPLLKRLTLWVTVIFLSGAAAYGVKLLRANPDLWQAYRPNSPLSAAELRAKARRAGQTCSQQGIRDYQWRWYAKDYPSPDLNWKLYELDGILCHGRRGHWLAFPVDAGEVRRYGCMATVTGLYCRIGAKPERHPKAEELIGSTRRIRAESVIA